MVSLHPLAGRACHNLHMRPRSAALTLSAEAVGAAPQCLAARQVRGLSCFLVYAFWCLGHLLGHASALARVSQRIHVCGHPPFRCEFVVYLLSVMDSDVEVEPS